MRLKDAIQRNSLRKNIFLPLITVKMGLRGKEQR